MTVQFDFVSLDAQGKTQAGDRSFIRKRCMQGKNKREDSRRTLREAKRDAAKLPPAPPHDLALVPFAAEINGDSREMLFKYYTLTTIRHSLSPLEVCVDFDTVERQSFDLLLKDSVFLETALLMSSLLDDFALVRASPGSRTLHHLRKTLALLNTSLSEKDGHLKESTLYVVVTLTILSAVLGDWHAANAHITGLQRIVKLRGGIKFLQTRPKLHYKVDRIDLSWCLSSGNKPRFEPDDFFWDPLFRTRASYCNPGKETRFKLDDMAWKSPSPLEGSLSRVATDLLDVDDLVSEHLAGVYADLQYLTNSIDDHIDHNSRLTAECFQGIMSSLQSRLLQLERQSNDTISDILCLGMLAFMTTTYRVPGKKFPYTYLVTRLKKLFRRIPLEKPEHRNPTLELWLLMMCAVSVFDSDLDWLTGIWRTLVKESHLEWEDVSKRLKRVIWISRLHDGPGEKGFRILAGGVREIE